MLVRRFYQPRAAFAPGAAPAYTGPGDVQALTWWGGLRAYSAAKAAATAACIDVVDDAVGSTTTTINLTTAGDLDVAAISALGYAVRVSKVYDQVGTDHAVQTTHSQRPALSLSGGPGGKPTMVFVRANSQRLVSASLFLNQPFSIIAAGQRTGNTTSLQSLFGFNASSGALVGFGSSANRAGFYAGTVSTSLVANDNTYHTLYCNFNGASSDARIDAGSGNTINPGANAGFSASIGVCIGTNFLDGNFLEGGILSGGAMSDPTAVANNMKTYWGI